MISHLWPRRDFPHLGIFVADQTAELARLCELEVVSPLDLTPRLEEINLREIFTGFSKYRLRINPLFSEISGIKPTSLPFKAGFLRRKFAIGAARHLASALKRIPFKSYDLVHAHTLFPDGLACALWLNSRPVPLVVTAHGSDVHSMTAGVRNSLSNVLRRADRILSVSRALQKPLLELGAATERLEFLPNGFSAELFDLSERPKRDPNLVAFLGRLSGVKRVDLLIRAMRHCRQDIRLEIAGDGPDRGRLEALVDHLRLRRRVQFRGVIPREEVPAFLAQAALLCLVSGREGWPTVIFEALACGTPVLATEVGGIPEALCRAEYGELVPVSVQPEELARRIQVALQKKWDAEALRSYAHEFSWKMLAQRLFQLYANIIEERSGKSASV
jgi:glycosyltransferase involved in cell wall biosynthesis